MIYWPLIQSSDDCCSCNRTDCVVPYLNVPYLNVGIPVVVVQHVPLWRYEVTHENNRTSRHDQSGSQIYDYQDDGLLTIWQDLWRRRRMSRWIKQYSEKFGRSDHAYVLLRTRGWARGRKKNYGMNKTTFLDRKYADLPDGPKFLDWPWWVLFWWFVEDLSWSAI